jgi:hypothetical protein
MGQKSLRALVGATLASATFVVFPAGASAGLVANERSDLAGSGGALNLCTGEFVNFTGGTAHLVVVETGSGSAVSTLSFSGAVGVGESGNTYKIIYANPLVLQDDGAGGYTAIVAFDLIQVGSGTNYVQHQTGHLTVTPDGEVVIEFYDLSENCTG